MKKIHLILMLFILATVVVGVCAIGVLDIFPPPWPDAPLASQGPAPQNAIPFTTWKVI